MTAAEYLEWEPQQPLRYEYVNGSVFAIAAGSTTHDRIALNFATALENHLAGTCKVYQSAIKVQIAPTGPYHYPDLVVTCDPRDQASDQLVAYPCLIVEVLSAQTEADDRGAKFARYRRLKTLKEYVLIQSEQKEVDCFRRNDQGVWFYQPYDATATMSLESVGFTGAIADLYHQVN